MIVYILIIILITITLLKSILLFVIIIPNRLIYKLKKKNDGKLPESNNPFIKCIKFIYRKNINIFDDLCLYWISKIPCHHIRNFYYKHVYLIDIAENVVIYKGTEIRAPSFLKIGKGSIVGDNAILDARAGITIKENVCLASNVSIWTLQHDYRDPEFKCMPTHCGPVTINNRAWIGPNTIILHNVIIGEGAVVAAGAVVTKDVPPYSLVCGIPAKVIGKRPTNLTYEFNGKHRHFI